MDCLVEIRAEGTGRVQRNVQIVIESNVAKKPIEDILQLAAFFLDVLKRREKQEKLRRGWCRAEERAKQFADALAGLLQRVSKST